MSGQSDRIEIAESISFEVDGVEFTATTHKREPTRWWVHTFTGGNLICSVNSDKSDFFEVSRYSSKSTMMKELEILNIDPKKFMKSLRDVIQAHHLMREVLRS